jgi:hypothetical protein
MENNLNVFYVFYPRIRTKFYTGQAVDRGSDGY